MSLPSKFKFPKPNQQERGQALIEYALIVVLVAIIFGTALAATGPVIGNVFSNSITDLLGQNVTVTHIPDKEDFWLTVTYAAENPPQEKPVPSNTPAPPTTVPTDGPPPTATEVVPTNTPSPTRTPTLTPTPWDEIHELPWYDSVEDTTLNWWRADPNLNTSGSPWHIQFFNRSDLTDPVHERLIANPNWLDIDFTGDADNPWAEGVNGTHFSVRLTRDVQLAADTILTVRALIDDGARVKYQRVDANGDPIPGEDEQILWNQWARDTGQNGNPQWFSGSVLIEGDGLSGSRTRITVEYNQKQGPSRLKVLVQGAAANPDDLYVNNSGNPADGAFSCGWGQNFRLNANDANTELGMWDEFVDGELPRNSRCNLELRGAVEIPPSTSRPELVFWSVWDLKASASAWLEVSEYVQATKPLPGGTPAPVPSADRDEMSDKWIRVNLHSGGTRNYNWTRHVVNLRNLRHSDNTPLDFTKPITFRFVIQNTNGAASNVNRWYIDDVRVHDAGPEKVFKLNHPVWTLDNEEELDDFIFTGGKSLDGTISGWGLTSNHKLGPSGMSFHDSVGPNDGSGKLDDPNESTRYKRHSESPKSFNDDAVRINYLEFNGWIDLDTSIQTDILGNKGDPVLSFYQAYIVGSNTGLEVQWTADPFTNATPTWRTFDGGVIRDVEDKGSVDMTTFQEHVVLLKDLAGDPSRIRIRFAQKVHTDAVRRDGWWIDEIRIGREETPRYLDYPFYDGAQHFTNTPMRYFGMWGQSDQVGRRNANEPLVVIDGEAVVDPTYKRMSYSSSPNGNYNAGQVTSMQTRFAVDLFNDTQTNPAYDKVIWGRLAECPVDEGGAPVPDCLPMSNRNNTHNAAAINPVLSFYHWRDLGNSDGFEVLWKRIDAPESEWKTLWFYDHARATVYNKPNALTAKQHAWEYVEIDLTDMMRDIQNNNTASVRDDDVVFRFQLNAVGVSVGAGIYIDDIRLFERQNENTSKVVFKLWSANETRNDPITGQALGSGNGLELFDDPDGSSSNRGWTESWFNGGDWFAVDWESHSNLGLMSFHDSPIGGQNKAPNGFDAYIGESSWFTKQRQFSVLELNHIIDLRAVDSITEAPALSFWTRYHLGSSQKIRVEVSQEMRQSNGQAYTEAELDSDIRKRCGNRQVRQCYEQRRGWTAWETVPLKWEITTNSNSEARSYGWTRAEVDLEPYSANAEIRRAGKRIRIRFVYDTLSGNNNSILRDGWYIDHVKIGHTRPSLFRTWVIRENTYSNTASSMSGMTPEGKWGLDPNIYEGSASAPSGFGFWTARWWNCSSCPPLANWNYANGASVFLQSANRRAPDFTNSVAGINYDMGNGKPIGTPNNFPTDLFVGEFTLDTPVVGSPEFPVGNRMIIVSSDDGVRVKTQELLPNGSLGPNANPQWNVIDKWREQSLSTSTGQLNLQAGKRYRITMQYMEAYSSATLTAIIGDGRYSFSDSPRIGGTTAPDEPPIPYGNTSLLLEDIMDLRGLPSSSVVVMAYRTRYRIGGSGATARVEVSNDGGFSWRQERLGDWANNINFNGPNISNSVLEPYMTSFQWQQRYHNLTSYKGSQLLIRFRFDRQNVYCARNNKSGNDNGPREKCMPDYMNGALSGEEFQAGFFDGWWISNIIVTAQ